MIKTYIKCIALSSALMFGAASCNTVLDVEPTDIIDADKAYETTADLEQALNGVYFRLPETAPMLFSSWQADDAKIAVEGGRNIGVSNYNWSYDAGSAPGAWSSYYVAIDAANKLLAGAEKLLGTVSDNEKKAINAIIGETKALRAYAYFELLRTYGESYTDLKKMGVPVVTESKISEPARNTVGEVYTQVEKDLQDAYTALKADGGGSTEATRFNMLAVKALEARVALYKQDYAKAIAASNEVLASKPIADSTAWVNMFNGTGGTDEVLFEFSAQGVGTTIGDFFRDNFSTINFYPSDDAINAFTEAGDYRFGITFLDPATAGATADEVAGYESAYLVGKFEGPASQPLKPNVVILRSSEILLIRAEAYAQTGDLVNALADLNTLRSARIMGYTPGTEASKNALMDAIVKERRLELMYEGGHRFFDMRRLNKSIVRVDVSTSFTPKVLAAGDYRFVMPIPSSELFANTNMKQNPQYTQVNE